MKVSALLLSALLALVFVAGCSAFRQQPGETAALERLLPSDYPDFADMGSSASLAESVSRSLAYYAKLPPDTKVVFGPDYRTAADMSASLTGLYYMLLKDPSPPEIAGYVRENFDVYMAAGIDGYGSAMFTGYYTPELAASREPDDTYRYPLYAAPDDLVSAELAEFMADCKEPVIRGRVADGKLVPYYTRAQIDGFGAIAGRGLELAYCADPVDVFFLHVQGSGMLAFTDGTRAFANYDGQNGRPYRSIGKLLVDEGRAELSEMSMDFLYSYLHDHPGELGRVLAHNESYVFFKLDEAGPYGSIGVPVTPGRTIATDAGLFPKGTLCFIQTEVPEFAPGQTEPKSWERYSMFVMNQDTGGAIKCAGRADIYFGPGELAKKRAGHMRKFGTMYFLAGKRTGR